MAISPDSKPHELAVNEALSIINRSKQGYQGWGNSEKIATVSAVLLNTAGSYFLPDYISPFQLHPITIGFTIYTYWSMKDCSTLLQNLIREK